MNRTEKNAAAITEGSVWTGLLRFFFPILLGTFFQQFYNTVDTMIVGRFIGKEALAAVGGGAAIYVNLLIGFFSGLSSGSTIIISQLFGARRGRDLAHAVHTAMWIAVTLGAIMTAGGIGFTPTALNLIGMPEEIRPDSELYLRIYFTAIIPIFVYNMGAGILRATGDSESPFRILVTGCVVNIALDLLFVPALRGGIAGAAWATVLSQCACMVLVLLRIRKDRNFCFRNIEFPQPHLFRRMIRLGLPAGIQASLYSVSNLIVASSVNAFGTDTIASWTAYGRLDSLFWMTVGSFGIAITTFSGQNFGARKYDRIKRANAEGLVAMAVAAAGLSVLFHFTGRYIYRLFTDDAAVIEGGVRILKFLSPFFIVYIPVEVLSGTIRGAGKTFVPMIISMCGICALRAIWIFTAVPLRDTLFTALACYPISWAATSAAFFIYYGSGRWLRGADQA